MEYGKSEKAMELEMEIADETVKERYELAAGRIEEIAVEGVLSEPYREYFERTAQFLKLLLEEYRFVESGKLKAASLEELKEHNHALYADVLDGTYEKSYANPVYAVKQLGEEIGRELGFLYTELRCMIPYVYETRLFELTIRMELFLEVYSQFVCAVEEEREPEAEEIRRILYWFVSDYSEIESYVRRREQLDPKEDFAAQIVMESDLTDVRYLYYYGEYVTENEIRTARHLASLPEEKIAKMADTYTEGYRIGFQVTGKEISKKKVVDIRFCLGFERMIRRAVQNFGKMGLEPVMYRAVPSIFHKKGVHKIGYYGAVPNKQYEFDHKEDDALFLDKLLLNRRLEGLKESYEAYKEQATVHGGPAVLEIFGEFPFAPENKKEACAYSEAQQKLAVEYSAQAGQLVNRYIPGEERSFTIIAFPTPEIGEQYEEIFDEVIRINTLDYALYQKIQQNIIDVLDQGVCAQIKGMNGNRTDLQVAFFELSDPAHQTVFENCVADVNIPVGEVFTSPRLEGTNGVLHVTRVFLNELEYRDLELRFQDGMIADYSCSNFETAQENRKYVRDNVLYHHETLPMGEFAIGTNTTAYVAAGKFHMTERLPILIAEKMGPHFAVGDTCYSHEEENHQYNPDGKEIVAKENSVSVLRHTEPEKAYFNCHTDITIPYDELGELSVIKADGEKVYIIKNGRFVLQGCEELNKPFENV